MSSWTSPLEEDRNEIAFKFKGHCQPALLVFLIINLEIDLSLIVQSNDTMHFLSHQFISLLTLWCVWAFFLDVKQCRRVVIPVVNDFKFWHIIDQVYIHEKRILVLIG